MMGHRQVAQAALFYEFSLEGHVPADHLLRSIDRFVELGELRRELAAFYSAIGRPSVDPELMIRMLIIGYCFGIRSERRLNDDATMLYRASKHDCAGCALKPRCCPNSPARKVPRSIHEGARDMAREIAQSWEGHTSRRLRKKIEMLFAHLKRILNLGRLRLRGPNGARDEFLLAATAQNLRKLAKLIPIPNLKPA